MDIDAFFATIGASSEHLVMRDLRPLTDLDPGLRPEFLNAWRRVPTERRLEIVRAMVELAEDNVDLQFNQALEWFLEDSHAGVRAAAIEGLWESDSPRVLRRLIDILRTDGDAKVREAAAMVLSRFAYMAELGELDDDDSDRLREALIRVTQDVSQPSAVRRRALESVGYYASDDDVQQIVADAYAGSDSDMQESSLVAMGRSMLPRWLPVIERELGSRSPAMRYEAARAAGEMADEARPLVVQVARLLGDSDTEVALAAIWALGQIGGEAATRALRQVQSRSESEARIQAASDALAELALDQGIIGDVRGFPRPGNNN